jgi:alkylation response protein AidB-like acyl-CoA dehydrogenase
MNVPRSPSAPGFARRFPAARAEKRRVLLDAVDGVGGLVAARADEAEAAGTLSAAAVQALDESGLFALKLPEILGGAEADPVTQIEVIERMAHLDASTAWCLMVGATTIALPAAFLPDEALALLLTQGRMPRAAGVFMPTGRAIEAAGGFRVTGRWAYASGIRHAQWLSATARVVRGGEEVAERRSIVFPTEAARIHDNWQVAGLRGTGSCDFSVEDLFVPEAFTWNVETARPRRGGPLYRLGFPAFVANEHAAFALGVGGRALEAIVALARSKARGVRPSLVGARATFHRYVGESELRLRAARALTLAVFEEAWSMVSDGRPLPIRLQAETRSTAVHATEVALDVVTRAFRYGGGAALYQANVLQRCLRDMNAGAQHLIVSDTAYENLGQIALEIPGADPMA